MFIIRLQHLVIPKTKEDLKDGQKGQELEDTLTGQRWIILSINKYNYCTALTSAYVGFCEL